MTPAFLRNRWFICAALLLSPLFGGGGVHAAPAVLSLEDAGLYRAVFAAQSQGRWAEADALIVRIEDALLMGYVQGQRYLDSSYSAVRFADLQKWLKDYRDLPGADKIYAAARRRGKGDLTAPVKRQPVSFSGPYHGGNVMSLPRPTSSSDKKKWSQFRNVLFKGNGKTASQLAGKAAAMAAAPSAEHDRLWAGLAQMLYFAGYDEQALEVADAVAGRQGGKRPQAYWIAGLASWRMGDFDGAYLWFSQAADVGDAAPGLSAAGAYWASRAALRIRRPEEASALLLRAAQYPGSFYGLVARRALGVPLSLQWDVDALEADELEQLKASKAGLRALALIQVGKTAPAEEELRWLYPAADAGTRDVIAHLAGKTGMAALSLTLAGQRQAMGRPTRAAAQYPIPFWEPDGGWSVDRALIFALARQESGFNPRAKSSAGARGVMQIMPKTAAFMAPQVGLSRAESQQLHDLETNLAIAQEYIRHLLSLPEVENNLFFLIAAYNAGPGNLRKWKESVRHGGDPLLFIESIPVQETRNHIERVLTNAWLYYDRLGQDAASLSDVAGGRWPYYDAADMRKAPEMAVSLGFD